MNNYLLVAGDAFSKAAELQLTRLDSSHEAANYYAEAAQVYKKAIPISNCYHRNNHVTTCIIPFIINRGS